MDAIAAVDALPELYQKALAAYERLAALIDKAAPGADIVFAVAELADFRAAFERAAGEVLGGVAGLVLTAWRQGLREGRESAAAELAQQAAASLAAIPPPRALRAV